MAEDTEKTEATEEPEETAGEPKGEWRPPEPWYGSWPTGNGFASPPMASESARRASSAEQERAAAEAFRTKKREVLSSLQGPEDLRELPAEKLPELAAEIRGEILRAVAENGGHFSSNFGVVELTIALHRVFDFSRDHLLFDVGHQVYPHKLLTGRFGRFQTLRTKGGISGYPNPRESSYDLFVSGHAGAASGLATGLAEAARLKGEDRRVIVVIGDGALTTGMAYEALNHAGSVGLKNFLVVLNDNGMSIARTSGAVSRGLARVRTEPLYRDFREKIRLALSRLPVIGGRAEGAYNRLFDVARRAFVPGQFFRDLNIQYLGPVDGHDINGLLSTLQKVATFEGPLLLHVVTEKGHGFPEARSHPDRMHAPSRELLLRREGADGSISRAEASARDQVPYTKVFAETVTRLARDDERIVAITAAMPTGTGLEIFGAKHPDRLYDVGICEQHAVAFAAGLARNGYRPVVAVYSTFLQRAFDQIFHEVCLQENIPVLFALDRAGLVGTDGPTHAGLYDIAYLRVLPGIVLMAPKDGREFEEMLRFSLSDLSRPVAIRYPRCPIPEQPLDGDREFVPLEVGRGEILREGEGVALLAYGAMVAEALGAAEIIKEGGVSATVANARFAKPLDVELVQRLLESHEIVVTIEDHALAGGFGSAVLEQATAAGLGTGRIARCGVGDAYVEHARREEQLAMTGLSAERIAERVRSLLEGK